MTHGQGALPAVCPSMLQQSQQSCMFVAMNDAAAAAAALHLMHRQCKWRSHSLENARDHFLQVVQLTELQASPPVLENQKQLCAL